MTAASRLWGLDQIHADSAWSMTNGSPDVVVAVIDTGIDVSHPDLAANVFRNPGEVPNNGMDDDGNGFVDDVRGWDFYNNDNNPMDDHSHGTHVAGTIAAIGNNGVGVVGVNWSARIPTRAKKSASSLRSLLPLKAEKYRTRECTRKAPMHKNRRAFLLSPKAPPGGGMAGLKVRRYRILYGSNRLSGRGLELAVKLRSNVP